MARSVYNAGIMNNKLWIITMLTMVLLAVIQLLIFSNISARLDVIERHLDVIRDTQVDVNH